MQSDFADRFSILALYSHLPVIKGRFRESDQLLQLRAPIPARDKLLFRLMQSICDLSSPSFQGYP